MTFQEVMLFFKFFCHVEYKKLLEFIETSDASKG